MLVTQGKVLSPGREGSMAVIVQVYLFPNFVLFVFICQFQGFLFPLFYWCNSMYMPNARVSVCTVR